MLKESQMLHWKTCQGWFNPVKYILVIITIVYNMIHQFKIIIFEGSDNIIALDLLVMGKFICSFRNISVYPFGEQFCDFGFFIEEEDNKLTELLPKGVGYSGVSHIAQYNINGWFMEEGSLDGEKLHGIVVSVQLVLDKLRK